MNTMSNAIGITFGVEGGPSTSGATGKQIKADLKALLQNLSNDPDLGKLSLDLKINEESLKKSIDNALNTIPTSKVIEIKFDDKAIKDFLANLKSELHNVVADALKIHKAADGTTVVQETTKTKAGRKSTGKATKAELVSVDLPRELTIKLKADTTEIDAAFEALKQKLDSLVTTFPFVKNINSVDDLEKKLDFGSSTKQKSGGTRKQSDLAKNKTIIDEYVRTLKAVQAEATRTESIVVSLNQETNRYEVKESGDVSSRTELLRNFRDAEKAYNDIFKLKETSDQKQYHEKLTDTDLYDLNKMSKLAVDVEKKIRTASTNFEHLKAKAGTYLNTYENVLSVDGKGSSLVDEIKQLMSLDGATDFSAYDKLNSKLSELQDHVNNSGLAIKSMGLRTFEQLGTSIVSKFATAIIGLGAAFKEILPNVKQIDTALTQLKIVIGGNTQAINDYSQNIAVAAKRIGASIDNLVRSTTTFARLGYTLNEATKFAELTAAYAKVADTDVSEATTAITTIIKAFGVETDELELLLDKLMYVGQNFPISASELGTGFANAGSALKAAGNDINESIALLTAANTQIQDISKASTALRTIVARINRAEADLSELGEDSEGVLTTAKLQEFMSAFGVSVVDANGELRKTYDILQDLSNVWDDLTSTERASIAEKLAGTRQQSIFFGLMNSFKSEAVSVMAEIDSVSGALESATAQRVNSIQGRLDQIRATWESLSTKVLNSELVKGLLEPVASALDAIDNFKYGDVVAQTATLATALGAIMVVAKSDFGKKLVQPFKDFFGNIKNGSELWFKVSKQIKNDVPQWEADIKKLTETQKLLNDKKNANIITDEELTQLGKVNEELNTNQENIAKVKKRYEELGGAQRLTAFQANLAITALTLLISTTYTVLTKMSQAWHDNYEEAERAYQTHQQTVQAYDQEISSLETLQARLKDAKGDRVALANIYDELNSKITVSTDLITGETQAYKDANAELETRIAHEKDLRNIAAQNAKEAAERKFDINRLSVGSGLSTLWADDSAQEAQRMLRTVDETTRQELLAKYGVDEYADAVLREIDAQYAKTIEARVAATGAAGVFGPAIQGLVGGASLLMGLLGFDTQNARKEIAQYVDYDVISQMTDDQRKQFFSKIGITSEAYDEYITAQVENAQQGLAAFAAEFKTSIGGEADANQIIGDLVKRGYDLNEIVEALQFVQDIDAKVVDTKRKWEEAVKNNPDQIADSYANFQDVLTEITDKYPELTKYVNAYRRAIEKTTSSMAKQQIESLSLLDILEKMQTVFDGLVAVMDKYQPGEIIDTNSLQSLLKLEASFSEYNVKLKDLLTETADGYMLNADALETLTEKFVDYYSLQIAYATDDTVNVAIDNLEKARIVLATWFATSQKEAKNNATQKALNAEKDLLQKQLDAYKELIELRKTLLKSYEEELEYQRELQKKQQTVSDLQTKLAIAQLDTSAAGRARTRQLESELKKAQDELNDFNLDHAISVLTQDLDDQYEEYKKYINSLIQDIEDKLDAIKNATEENEPNYDWIKYYIEKIDAVLTTYRRELSSEPIDVIQEPIAKPTYTGEQQHPMTDSYKQHLDDKYNSFIPTEEELLAPNPYATAYLRKNELLKYVDDHASINGFIFSPNVPSSKYYDPRMAQIWESLNEDAKYEIMEYVKQKGIPFRAYHSGGYVEGSSRTSEIYAKLMTGEYVSTPLMIKQFVEKTIPAITGVSSYNGANTFNSPLIEINCDNISQEALPQFRNIVNEAVNEIKKQLDDGVSRAGRMKDVRRLNI